MSKLIIPEPPLQVLPALALAIGLNEAIMLQQLYWLLGNPRNGRRVGEHQWIFNTLEQWQSEHFPFWSVRTIKRIMARLASLKLVLTCQPEGRLSRRKYYRIDDDKLLALSDGAKLASSKGTIWNLPKTETSVQRLQKKARLAKNTPILGSDGVVVLNGWQSHVRTSKGFAPGEYSA